MDKKYMKLAIELAKKGEGNVNPNPLVGAIIVKDNKVISTGYHEHYGGNHAEVNAFNNAKEDVSGATLYVTLEPCSHYGKTPPCAQRIIKEKIKKVVIGCIDFNPIVSGNGVRILKEAGIEVITNVLEEECKKINEIFNKYIVKKKPFIVMKWAMSLDGKIATYTGESKWISGEASRQQVHKLRNKVTAIMVGVDTVIKDNPLLTCRVENGKNPIRIIVDSNLRTPIGCNIVATSKEIKTIITTKKSVNKNKAILLQEKGVEIIYTKEKENKVDLNDLMCILGEMKIDSILLEGGATLNFSALQCGIVDKVQVYISPKVIGGEQSKTPIEGKGIKFLKDAFKLKDMTFSYVDEDIFIEGYISN
ncbi:bifunctional diaminohydroxyphosphoribosylaminopyrimidine deaminase/5-amino-6-(5-phosphoribosylamino)uracil reductase RibD [Clostridium tarantellae]|uniref:Riboflavin biosynthesis protein RibD n=1 Tax=Clostridium tarantellae TaxID=39493 RepID=A0A6I1ML17_9CLOT|nr:bifunctional diaminohydroxyphosphoribosylaminopyrimidine deaminase/5-amino-6-(5-phosphoribosylamino)uracil reductase RibD [Clostridium tarantellae]MPQ44095.1 bifunctional diaminohydroxyphosphoribosylaminopyrimidine deaminase/5-amino-6-(5-phosphoribosylamino)uracil reductase RibD [Clostridium tarantellae]